jgi:hypothetical protein
MYGEEAKRRAEAERGDDYDPEEDFLVILVLMRRVSLHLARHLSIVYPISCYSRTYVEPLLLISA